MKKQTTVSFADIFRYAEKFGVTWNQANNIFFTSEILTYKGYNEIYKDWFIEHISDPNINSFEECQNDDDEALWIIRSFMQEHKLKEMLVLND